MRASSQRRAEPLSCKKEDCDEDFKAWFMPQKIGSEVPACMKAFNVKKEVWRSQGPWRRCLEHQEEALMQHFSELMDLTGHPGAHSCASCCTFFSHVEACSRKLQLLLTGFYHSMLVYKVILRHDSTLALLVFEVFSILSLGDPCSHSQE